jgi:hypothetical protein
MMSPHLCCLHSHLCAGQDSGGHPLNSQWPVMVWPVSFWHLPWCPCGLGWLLQASADCRLGVWAVWGGQGV